MLSFLAYVSVPSVCPPWRSVLMSVLILGPFFNWIVCLPGVELCEFFIYFGDQTLVWGIIGKCIFPYGWFHILYSYMKYSQLKWTLNDQGLGSKIPIFILFMLFLSLYTFTYFISQISLFTDLMFKTHQKIDISICWSSFLQMSLSVTGLVSCL